MATTVICIGALVRQRDQVLLVRQASGHSLAGTWTIPWGILEQGESLTEAAVRETMEESHVRCRIEGLLGVQELPSPWLGWIAHIFQCAHLEGTPQGDGTETDQARYFSRADLERLSEPIDPFCNWLIKSYFERTLTCPKHLGFDSYRMPGYF